MVEGRDVATLADGSTIVVGHFSGSPVFGLSEPNQTTLASAGGLDLLLARYRPDGTLLWARRAGGAWEDTAGAVSVAPDGTFVVSGFYGQGVFAPTASAATFGPGEPNQTTLPIASEFAALFIARFDPNGALLWVRGVQGFFNASNDFGTGWASSSGIAALPDGSSLVTGGITFGSATFGVGEPNQTARPAGFFIARYNADGTLDWARGASMSSSARGRRFGALPDGTAVVTGAYSGTATFGAGEPNQTVFSSGAETAFVARYNPDGTLAWAKRAQGGSQYLFGATIFADGSSAIAGKVGSGTHVFGPGEANQTTLPGSGQRMFVARYNPGGTLAWVKHAPMTFLFAGGIGALSDGSIIVTTESSSVAPVFGTGEPGQLTLPAGGTFLARYLPSGTFSWARRDGARYSNACRAFADDSVVATGIRITTSTFGAGEPNETTLSGPGMHVVRYQGPPGAVSLVVPPSIVQECDDEHGGATVNFLVEVQGSPPSGAVLTVTDLSLGRTLLSQPAAAGTVGVGPHDFGLGASTIDVRIVSGVQVLASASFPVQIQDTTAPEIFGCEPKIVECQGPLTVLFRSLLGISAADHCDPTPTIAFNPSAVPMGTTDVTVVARDDTGNSSECSIAVTVVDTTPPEFEICPDRIERDCADGECGASVSFDVVATDLCGVVVISCVDEDLRVIDPAGSFFEVGLHTVTCTASDPSGNAVQCVFDVEIVDRVDPVIECPADITVPTAPGLCVAFVDFEVVATDLCDPHVQVTCAAPWGPVESGDAFPCGLTTVRCTAVDRAGNVAEGSFGVLVLDGEAPVFSGPSTVTLVTDCAGSPLSVTAESLGVTATDNCDVDPLIVVAPASLGPGTTTVVCRATDDDGNERQKSVEVTVLKGPFELRFLRPLDPNVDNLIRAGRPAPIKVRVACDNVFESEATVTVDRVEQIDGEGSPIANEVVDDVGASSDNGTTMRLVLDEERYVFNLATSAWPATSGARFRVVVRATKVGHADTFGEVILVNR